MSKASCRFGELTVDAGGSSKIVSDKEAEGVFFILAGSGTLHYGQDKAPVKQNDFVYLPVGVEYGVSNQSQEPLRLLVMTFRIPEGVEVPATPKLMTASADDVRLQVLPSHGPTTQFKLLMGTTQSKRDKLAVAQQINSLFLMDFAAGRHEYPPPARQGRGNLLRSARSRRHGGGQRRGEKGNTVSHQAGRCLLFHAEIP